MRVLFLSALLAILCLLAACVFWWIPAADRGECHLQLRSYNQFVFSLGVLSNSPEVWADPSRTEQAMIMTFHRPMPACPASGTYSLVHGIGEHPNIPKLVCSMEHSHGHGPAYDH